MKWLLVGAGVLVAWYVLSPHGRGRIVDIRPLSNTAAGYRGRARWGKN